MNCGLIYGYGLREKIDGRISMYCLGFLIFRDFQVIA